MPSKLGKFKKVHPKGPAEPGGCNCPTPTYFGSLVIALFHTGVGGQIMPSQGCRPWGCWGCHGKPQILTDQ